MLENMADNTDTLYDGECITKLIKKVFEDEFKKQKQKLAAILKSLCKEVNMLEMKMEFTKNDLEE